MLVNVSGFNLFGLKTTQRVSPYSSELEMNLTSSFLLQSDKLVMGPHLLLSPAITVVKPAEHEPAHRPNPVRERVSKCSQLNHKSKLYSVCGRTTALTS